MLKLANLDNQIRTLAGSKVADNDVGRAAMNPASKRRARDIEFWK